MLIRDVCRARSHGETLGAGVRPRVLDGEAVAAARRAPDAPCAPRGVREEPGAEDVSPFLACTTLGRSGQNGDVSVVVDIPTAAFAPVNRTFVHHLSLMGMFLVRGDRVDSINQAGAAIFGDEAADISSHLPVVTLVYPENQALALHNAEPPRPAPIWHGMLVTTQWGARHTTRKEEAYASAPYPHRR
jgi:hypothetical protein